MPVSSIIKKYCLQTGGNSQTPLLIFFLNSALCVGTIYLISYFIHDVQEYDTTTEKITEKSSTCQMENFSKGEKAAKIMVKAT